MVTETVLETDILVIGGGFAGVFAAVKAKEQGNDVILVDKGTVGRSGLSPFARGFHYFNEETLGKKEDFMEGCKIFGEYINNLDYLESYCDLSKGAKEDLEKWGLFGNVKYAEALSGAIKKAGVRVIKRTMITDLIKQDGKIVGAVGFPMEGNRFIVIKAKAVISAAGAGGFKPNGFPCASITSDSDAMAYRAGAEITGKEFVDTHDTVFENPADCWIGWGRHWSDGVQPGWSELEKNLNLERTFSKNHGVRIDRPNLVKEENLPVDSQGNKLEAGRGFTYRNGEWHPMPIAPYPKPAMPGPDRSKNFESAQGASAGLGVHKSEGIWPSDTKCASTIPGLFAAGDALGSMMLGSVYSVGGGSSAGSAVQGIVASQGATEYIKGMEMPEISQEQIEQLKQTTFEPLMRTEGFHPSWVTQMLQNTVIPAYVLYIKSEERLKAALTNVEYLRDQYLPKLTAKTPHELRHAHELKSMMLNAEMKIRASLLRTESRGNHYREDYPARDDDNWLVWIKIKNDNGQMALIKEPVPEKWRPSPELSYEERYQFRFPGELEYLEKNNQ
jgi:succinate dehydrogenase/fumarate reductase flavoprotein subunit